MLSEDHTVPLGRLSLLIRGRSRALEQLERPVYSSEVTKLRSPLLCSAFSNLTDSSD